MSAIDEALRVLRQGRWRYRWLRRAAALVGWRVALLVWRFHRRQSVTGRRDASTAVRARVRGFSHPVWIRPGTSDLQVLQQILDEQSFATLDRLPVRTVIDCGAYAGYTTLYFLHRFPRAIVVACEPDPDNAAMLRKNIAPYADRVRFVEAAVWNRPVPLALVTGKYRDGDKWATQVVEWEDQKAPTVPGIDVPSLISLAGELDVDLLKMDIERAELVVFADGCERWLPHVKNLAIELHGEDCEEVLRASLRPFDYQTVRSGELTLCLGLQLRRTPSPTFAA